MRISREREEIAVGSMAEFRVAKDPRTPTATLVEMATRRSLPLDTDWDIRSAAIANPSLPVEVLLQLAEDRNASVRAWVGKNPRTPAHALARLAEDNDAMVRGEVANTPTTPFDLVKALASDPDPTVRNAAIVNPALPEDFILRHAEGDPLARQAVANNAATPPSVLRGLANDAEKGVRASVGANPNTPEDVIAQLLGDPDPIVRQFTAVNPKMQVQKQAQSRSGCFVATAVYGSYNAPPVMVLRRYRDERLSKSAAGRLFIGTYYRIGPHLAKLVKHGGRVSRVTKHFLDAVVERLDDGRQTR